MTSLEANIRAGFRHANEYCLVGASAERIMRLKMDENHKCPKFKMVDFTTLVATSVFYRKACDRINASMDRYHREQQGKCIICRFNPVPLTEREP